MRPSVREQLDQSARLLESVVAPAVSDRMPHIILDGVIDNLKLLSDALPQIPAFLAWDNAAMRGLLADFGRVSAESRAGSDARGEPDSGSDLAEDPKAEDQNEALRQRLADLVCSVDVDDERLAPIRRHLIERASRFPLRAIPSTPGGNADKAS